RQDRRRTPRRRRAVGALALGNAESPASLHPGMSTAERSLMSPYEDPKRWKALAVLGIAYLMVVLDVSIVNVALPSIQKDLDFAPENLQWVISGYALTFGGFLLLGGRVGDLLGRRWLFMVGLGAFALFSLACGLATTSGMLIAFRALQGMAGAIL